MPARSGFDVAIVGAGPAGAWAAYCLARGGARVALVDGSHPREKPCGGGVSTRALALLRDLPFGSMGGVDVTTARFCASSQSAAVNLPQTDPSIPALMVVSRRAFDDLLLRVAREAGAEHVARRVIEIARAGCGWTITTETHRLQSAWLIGADGANSLVRRRLSRPFGRSELSIASGYYVHGRSDAHIDIEFAEDPQGYLWSFPRPDHLAVGICAQADASTSAQLLAASARWIQRTCGTADSTLTRYSWPIPSLSERGLLNEQPAGPGWLLIGDAAGLVDPITRRDLLRVAVGRARGGLRAGASYRTGVHPRAAHNAAPRAAESRTSQSVVFPPRVQQAPRAATPAQSRDPRDHGPAGVRRADLRRTPAQTAHDR